MTTINSSVNNVDKSNSWGDMIRNIDHERKNLSWDPTLTKPVQKIGHYDVKKKEREYDIIAMKYRNPEKESIITLKREDLLRNKLKSAEDIKKNEFNFINHKGPSRKYDQMISNKEKIKPARQYNFFSNLNHDDHDQAPTIYDDEYAIQRAGRPKQLRPAIKKGEYNIINNYFFEKHDERIMKEFESFKDHTLQKYWQTHDYDPIRGKYYDIDKEIKFQQQRELITQVHGTSKDTKIPPSIFYSDGNAYNIVNHSVQDEIRLELSNTVANRSLNRMVRSKVEKKFKEDGQIAYDEAERSRLARVKFNRWEPDMDRGYDLVKNTIQPATRPQPLPSRCIPLWGKLQQYSIASTTSTNQLIQSYNDGASQEESYIRYNNNNNKESISIRARNLSGAGPTYTNITTTTMNNNLNMNSSNNNNASILGSNNMYIPPQTAPARDSKLGYNDMVAAGVQGGGGGIALPSIQMSSTTARARTAAAMNNISSSQQSHDMNRYNNSNHNKASSLSIISSVPSLDLSRAEQAPMVTYIEPTHGPSSMPIAMVRTGGFSSYRSSN